MRGVERLKSKDWKCLHANQKPLRLIERILFASTEVGDVVWEPFGGLCSALVAALRNGRQGYGAEINPEYFRIAAERLEQVAGQGDLFEQRLGEPRRTAVEDGYNQISAWGR